MSIDNGFVKGCLTFSHIHQLDTFLLGECIKSTSFPILHIFHNDYKLELGELVSTSEKKEGMVGCGEHDAQLGVVDPIM